MARFSRWFNWVDLVVLLLLVAALVVVLNRDRIVGDATPAGPGWETFTITLKAPSVPLEVAEAFSVGDIPMADGADLEARVTEVRTEPARALVVDGDSIEYSTDPHRYDLYLTFSVLAKVTGPFAEAGGQELKVGIDATLETEDARVVGYIVSMASADAETAE